MVERLFLAGADVFRVNMSHSSHETARELVAAVRMVSSKHRHPVGILADLQGPKFRLGDFHGGRVFVNDGETFDLDRTETPGSASRVFLPHAQIFAAIKPGHLLLLDDGKIRMRVTDVSASRIKAEVVTGGALASRKGISLPDTILPIGPLTAKDRDDLSQEADRGPRCRPRQDREAFGNRGHRRHHRCRGRRHGCARRPRRRDAG